MLRSPFSTALLPPLLFATLFAACGPDRTTGEIDGDVGSDVPDAIAPIDDSGDLAGDPGPDALLDVSDGSGAPACNTLGCPCVSDDECASGYCVDGGARIGRICSEFCAGECSEPGYDCVVLVNSGGDGVQLCVPGARSLCEPCVTDRNCGRLGDVCLEMEDGLRCAPDCSDLTSCPAGSTCVPTDVGGTTRSLCVPDLRVCSPCVDADGDGYGVGTECAGVDCDDTDDRVNEGAAEVCDGVDNNCDGFVDDGVDGSLNTCGGCGPLAAEPGEACGECDSGMYVCDGNDAVMCAGDLAEAAFNRCGGCSELTSEPGDACGACSSGVYVCEGTDAVTCEGDAGSDVANACGGCAPLETAPGTPCGVCDSGAIACNGPDTVACEGDLGAAARNVCGGCDVLSGAPGDRCGTCDTGSLACSDGVLSCFGDRGDAAVNACGGCTELAATPGSACGTCGSGAWVCDGTDAVRCEGDVGAAALNECGGCAALTGASGDACGTCGSGQLACNGTDALSCVGDQGDAARNVCGGCNVLPSAPGTACGTCDTGSYTCAGTTAVVCTGDRGGAALNACGGCNTLAIAPGTACGPCGDGAYVCSGTAAVTCAGATPDSDGDTICDDADICAGHNDLVDTDLDGVPNGCDRCAGFNDALDADSDGVPDGCDACSAGPDGADADRDGVPDACDCNLAGCSANADCAESSAGPTCSCRSGYTGDGFTCDEVQCPPLTAPSYGTLVVTGTTVGSTATLTCAPNHTLQGPAVRTCQASGAWTGYNATCPGTITCACSSRYSPGDRVVSVVDWVAAPNADGQTIGRGRLGTVLAGGQTGFPLLVAWDGWNNGHNGRCFAAQCGACSQSGSNKYWVYCNDVAPAP